MSACNFVVCCSFGHGADDEAAAGVGRQQCCSFFAQQFALVFVLDALRNADVGFLRQIHQKASGDADLGGQPRALGADRVLDHLHHQALPFVQDLLDRPLGLAAVALFPDVGHMQEGGALQADIDEGRLHARQHAHHAPQVDVADQAAACVRSMCSSCTTPCCITATRVSCGVTLIRISSLMMGWSDSAQTARPKALNKTAVSYSGSPMMPQ